MENEETTSGQPLFMLLAIPAFLLVWFWKAGDEFTFKLLYSSLSAVVVTALTYAVFVWIPDDQARKLNRKLKFAEARKLLDLVAKKLRGVIDQEIQVEVKKALPTFKGLIDTFEVKNTAQGKIEEKILPMLRNLSNLLARWSGHESGEFPLDKSEAKKIRGVLLHFDDLILKYQSDGIDATDTYLTDLYELETDMQSAGINPEGEK